MSDAFYLRWAPLSLSVLRIMSALLFIAHGTQKLFAWPVASPAGPPVAGSLSWVAGVMEIVISPLLVAGLWTRPLAFLVAGEMAVAYFLRHAPNGFWPIANRGENAALYCFIWLYFAAAGGGAWCMDRWLGARRARGGR